MPDKWEDVWKWIAVSAMSVLFGLLIGQFTPNRNIVTKDDLIIITQHEASTDQKLSDISTNLSKLEGEFSEIDGRVVDRPRSTQ